MRCFHAEEMAFGRAVLLVALSSPLRPATQPLQKEELSCGRRAALPCKAPEQNGFLVNSGTRKIEKRPRSPDGPKLREKERANVRRSLAYADKKSISVDQIRVVSGRCYADHQGSSLPASRWCKCALKFGLAASCIAADPLKKYDFVFAQNRELRYIQKGIMLCRLLLAAYLFPRRVVGFGHVSTASDKHATMHRTKTQTKKTPIPVSDA